MTSLNNLFRLFTTSHLKCVVLKFISDQNDQGSLL